MLMAPARELAQVQRVGLAGQAAVPGQESANARRSVLVNTGIAGTRAADGVVVVIGHLRCRSETPEAGPSAAAARNEKPKVRRPPQSRQVTTAQAHRPHETLPSADSERLSADQMRSSAEHRSSKSEWQRSCSGATTNWPMPPLRRCSSPRRLARGAGASRPSSGNLRDVPARTTAQAASH